MKRRIRVSVYNLALAATLMFSAFSVSWAGSATLDGLGKTGQSDVSFFFETAVEYDDNVFQLSDDQKHSMDHPETGDVASGRYDGMENASDVIVTPRIGLSLDTLGFAGGRTQTGIWGQFRFFNENQEKNDFEAGCSVAQTVGSRGKVLVKWTYLHDAFKKNYLSDADDDNGNGNIARDERTYSAARYDEMEGLLSYRHTFIKEKESLLSRLDLEPFGGSSFRTYDRIFDNRDRKTATCGLGARLGFLSRIQLDLALQYDRLRSPGDDELVLYDETVNSLDVNGDGDIKENAALVTKIDRSCHRYGFSIAPSLDVTDDLTVFTAYEWRMSDYVSDNVLDVDHYRKKVQRNEMKAGLALKLNKHWSMAGEYQRTDEEEPDDDDYVENSFRLEWRFDM